MNWLRHIIFGPLHLLVVIVEIYRRNRAWVQARLSRPGAAALLRWLVMGTTVIWLAVWLMTIGPGDGRLASEAGGLWDQWRELMNAVTSSGDDEQ